MNGGDADAVWYRLRHSGGDRRWQSADGAEAASGWLLCRGTGCSGAATSTMTVHIVGYLASRGHPATFAASTAGLLGVLSVTGRLLLTAARRSWQ